MYSPGRMTALLLILLIPAARAQMAPSPDAPPVSMVPSPAAEPEPVTTLRLNVNLVDVFFTVKDKDGHLVPHLTQEDCTIAEDNQPQQMKSFAAETRQPLTLGMLLDTSGSQYQVLAQEQEAGRQFLESVLHQNDEAFLLSFDVNVDLLQDFTNDSRLLGSALDRAEINSAGGNGAGGLPGAGGGTVPSQGTPRGTLLYDAVNQAASEKMNQETGRKAIILLTDGQDEGSRVKSSEAIAAAQRANIMIYVILIADRGVGGSGATAMKKMAEETGGRSISVGNNSKKLAVAFRQIEDELRTQYVASYVPGNPHLDGGFRKLAVTCRGDGLKVQVRKGYFAVAPQN